uniref:Uncharacterized protein n=1 Tax=Loxodonta africana TaxID=9785 RepID=G3T934_LOXAF
TRQKRYLEAEAQKVQASCPGHACYLYAKNTFEETCPYCFQWLALDNSWVHLKLKPKLTPEIKKLLNREAKNYTLSFKEAKIVKKYDSKSILLITCKTCKRTVKHRGKCRSFLSSLKSKPSAPTTKPILKTPERKTLTSTKPNRGMSASQGKSPALIFRTPTSEQSTCTFSSSKNTSKTKKHFSQQQQNHQEFQKNPKLDFRNFLPSL